MGHGRLLGLYEPPARTRYASTRSGGNCSPRSWGSSRTAIQRRSVAPSRAEMTLRLELVEAEGRRLEREHRNDPDALDEAMRGWALLERPYSREPPTRTECHSTAGQLARSRHGIDHE